MLRILLALGLWGMKQVNIFFHLWFPFSVLFYIGFRLQNKSLRPRPILYLRVGSNYWTHNSKMRTFRYESHEICSIGHRLYCTALVHNTGIHRPNFQYCKGAHTRPTEYESIAYEKLTWTNWHVTSCRSAALKHKKISINHLFESGRSP